jgi:MFS family permease
VAPEPGAHADGQGRALATAIAVTTICVLPAFLTGGLAVRIRADLGFGVAELGLAVTAFFASAALASALLGRVVERIGSRSGMLVATLLGALSLAGIGAFASSWGQLVGFLVLAGAGHALGHPASNLLLAGAIARRRQGLAFGLKQAAVLAATLLGGLATPIVGLALGWRSAFLFGAAIALAIGALVWRSEARLPAAAPRSGPRRARLGPLLLPTLGICLGSAAGVSLAAFLVEAGVASGMGESAAGLLLAVASAVGLAVRVGAGWHSDRRASGRLRIVVAMLVAGACGFGLLALADPGWPFVAGALLAFGLGWGWPGVFNFAIVDIHRQAPAAATGITQTGTYAGSAAGPLAFGLVVEHGSYTTAWLCSAGIVLAAAAAMHAGRPALVRERMRRGRGPDAPGAAAGSAAGG